MTRSLTRVQNPGAFLRVVLVISGAIVFAFCLDAFLFRTNLYTRVLEPDSSTGLFELILRREQQAQAENGDNLVITLGDSRFAYSPRLANELSPHGIVLRSAGVAGTDPRSWYYMLRDLDPSREHYRAVVLGVNDYDDEDEDFEPDDDIRALKYVIARLRITDTFEFAGSFYSPEFKWAAFRGALFKGTVYQADLLAFLAHPQKRRERALLPELCAGSPAHAAWTA